MKITNFSAILATAILLPSTLGAQKLLENADFSSGLDDWTTGCNLYDSTGTWTSYVSISSGTAISADSSAKTATLGVKTSSTATYTETIVFQDADEKYFQNGDVIHFKGNYSMTVTKNGSGAISPRVFIDGMDEWSAVKSWSVTVNPTFDSTAGKTTTGTFEFTATASDVSYLSVVRVGASLYLDDSQDEATLTISGLDAWLNDDDTGMIGKTTEGYWAGYAIDNSGYVNTGDWLGWIYPVDDWVWSCKLERWLYLPEHNVRSGGSWTYVIGQ